MLRAQGHLRRPWATCRSLLIMRQPTASALRCGSPTTRRRLQASSVRPRARASRRACHSRRRPSSRWVKTRQPSAPRSPMRLPCKRWSDAAAKFGCIDILVNNAALYGALCGGRFEAIGEAEWDDAMRANVKGIWQCCKAVVPQMRKAGGGSIINMASLATIYGMPFALHYTVSKAAVVGLTRGLARELGRDNIRVNSIAPSAVLTESTREFFGEKHERARGHCWRPGDPAQHHRADHRGR